MMPKRANVDLTTELLCTHRDDPANAQYVVPLDNAADEDTAHSMAEAVYCAYVDHFSPDITEDEAEYVWQQCLIDMRRMLCDPDYESMIMFMA